MALPYNSFGGGLIGLTNAAANTVIYAVIPGVRTGYPRVAQINYTAGNTANSIIAMRPIGRANVATNAITNVATLTLDADPSASGNTIAAGDQVVYGPCTDGTYRRGQVNTSGWDANTKIVTFTANLAANINTTVGKVWNFGVPADTDPSTGAAHPVIPTVANTTASLNFPTAGFVGGAKGDPLLIYTVNATNATQFNFIEYAYTTE